MPVATVRKGVYELEVGGPAGTIVSRREEPAEAPDRPGHVEQVENVVDRASGVTAKVERGKALFEDLADGKLEPAQITNSVDSLVGLLEKLDREGKHEDALRVARVLSKLLTLARRWADLLKALRAAERAGKLLGDTGALAWAKHELGTVRLLESRLKAADEALSEARQLRAEANDRVGLRASERNLGVLCERMRQMLRKDELVRRRLPRAALAGVFAITLLLACGMAAAVVGEGVGGARSKATRYAEQRKERKRRQARKRKQRVRELAELPRGRAKQQRKRREAERRRKRKGRESNGNGERRLDISFAGEGSGAVKSNPQGIECRQDCHGTFPTDQRVTLLAEADEDSEFEEFSGACVGTECRLKMNRLHRATASFGPKEYVLSVEVLGLGGGSVTSDPEGIECVKEVEIAGPCSESFRAGAPVSLTAVPGQGSLFEKFDDCASPCKVTMDGDRSVTVRFAAEPTQQGNRGPKLKP